MLLLLFSLLPFGAHHAPHPVQLGLTVFIIGLLQPLNAFVRPGKDAPLRRAWELLHKGVGYGVLPVAALTILFGLRLIHASHSLQVVFIVYAALFAVVFIAGTVNRYMCPHRRSQPSPKARHAPCWPQTLCPIAEAALGG